MFDKLSDNLIKKCFNEINNEKNKDFINNSFIIPICNNISIKIFPYIITIFIMYILILILIILIMFILINNKKKI
jgi:hypothetical protein